MPTKLRKLGVHGKNAPTKKSKTVQASDFNIGGMIGLFERAYDKAFEVKNPTQQLEIFGNHVSSAQFGNDAMKTFWDNLAGVPASMWIKSHVGFDGSNIDGVVAASTITDQNGLISLITLTASLLTAYDAHDADAELGIGWAYHAAQEASNHSLVSAAAPTNLAECIERLNDLKAKYNAHDADDDAHGTYNSHQESNPNATSLATAITLANSLKTVTNAHAADASEHTTAIDNVNYPIATAAASSTPASTLNAQAGYKAGTAEGALEYGISGNRTGYKIINGNRYSTTLAATVAAAATSAVLTSAIGVKIGDILVFNATGGTKGVINKKITNVDESTNTVTWSGAFDGGATITGQIGDSVTVPGFKIETYRKSISGIEVEVETALGDSWCTMESEVVDYYVQNVHSENRYLKASDLISASSGLESFPGEIQTITYLTNGAAGTTPTTSSHWARDLVKLDNLPVRFICNPESTNVSINKSGEVYCKSRDDSPFWIATLAKDQTKSQLITLGSGYQRSDDVLQINAAEWLKIDDPFNTAPSAPSREVPNCGAVMGAWIRSIANLGVHYIPAVDSIPLIGINGIVNSNLGDIGDQDRTDLAEYGINIIQFIDGQGYRIRNFFTPSISLDFQFANGLLMRNYIKVSSEDSLRGSENYPNSFNRIKEDREAIRQFMYRLWFRGSNGNVPEGETFGQQENVDGTITTPEDHFEVIADAVNNPLSDINQGKRNIQVYFTYPTPAGSIEISVGILLRG